MGRPAIRWLSVVSDGAPGQTRTDTPVRAQALNLPYANSTTGQRCELSRNRGCKSPWVGRLSSRQRAAPLSDRASPLAANAARPR